MPSSSSSSMVRAGDCNSKDHGSIPSCIELVLFSSLHIRNNKYNLRLYDTHTHTITNRDILLCITQLPAAVLMCALSYLTSGPTPRSETWKVCLLSTTLEGRSWTTLWLCSPVMELRWLTLPELQGQRSHFE